MTASTLPTARAESAARGLLLVAVALAAATVLAQIAYPLTPARQLGRLSVLTVLLACAACVTHALATAGPAWTAAFILVVVPGAFAVEVLGSATGVPFGDYAYAHSLGPLLAGVPLLVPLAWLMMGYPCWLLARGLSPRQGPTVLTGVTAGAAMAAWDVFLDPQMVAAGHWSWTDPSPALPGIAAVPLTNLIGWVVAAGLVMAVATAAVRPFERPSARPGPLELATPATLLAWTWVGGIVGNAVFFDRPAVAVWGGVLLGAFVAPYLLLARAR